MQISGDGTHTGVSAPPDFRKDEIKVLSPEEEEEEKNFQYQQREGPGGGAKASGVLRLHRASGIRSGGP